MGLALEKEPIYIQYALLALWMSDIFCRIAKTEQIIIEIVRAWGVVRDTPKQYTTNHTKSVLDHNKKSANSSTTVKGHTLLEKGPKFNNC